MKYGQIRLLVTQALPGAIAPELSDLHILGRFTQILDTLKWPRRAKQTVIQTTAPHVTGTVSVTSGSAAVGGNATNWSAGQTGLLFRVAGQPAYIFTWVSSVAGTLDRPWEGETATGLAYQLCQTVYSLPVDCRLLNSLTDLRDGPLERTEGTAWLELAPGAEGSGPLRYRLTADSATDPPRMAVELWPVPTEARGLRIEYSADDQAFSGSAPSASLLPWVRPQCLVEGAVADGLLQLAAEQPEKASALMALSRAHESRFALLLNQMLLTAAQNRGAVPLRLSRRYRLLG